MSDWSEARLARMGSAMKRHVQEGRLPGLVTALDRRGDERVDAIGCLAFDGGSPMRRDALFRVASMTKPITAVAAMILVEECKLRLDEPVDRWLPELADRKVLRTPASALDDTVPAKRPITVRDVLTFRCGYGEPFFVAGACAMQKAMAEARLPLTEWLFSGTADELMKRLGALPLVAQPGERWLYHMPAEILGVLVARASGTSLGAFLRSRVLEPLGMKDTAFFVPEAKLARLTTCYAGDPATGSTRVHDAARGGALSAPRAYESGAGGLVSTADDMLAFGRMMLGHGTLGRERVLSRASVELMTSDQITAEQRAASPFFPSFWDSFGWGLGVGVVTRRASVGRNAGSFGWDGAFGTSCWIDPKEGLVGVLMTQRLPDWMTVSTWPAVVEDFWTSTYQALD